MTVVLTYLKAQWDRSIAVLALVVSALVLTVGYFGISGTAHVAQQLPYFISAGAVAVLLVGVAAMMWISADLRDQWRELSALRRCLEAETTGLPLPAPEHLLAAAPAPARRKPAVR